jgi:hypothetical protein
MLPSKGWPGGNRRSLLQIERSQITPQPRPQAPKSSSNQGEYDGTSFSAPAAFAAITAASP